MTPKLTLFFTTELIDARGSGEPQAVSLMFQDVLSRLLSNSSSTVSESITYPAGFDQNVTSGVQETVSSIKSSLQQCPDQKFHLFGYSQGATLVQSSLQELEGDKKAMDAIRSVVVVGNPYRIPGSGKISDICLEDLIFERVVCKL
ncbi:family 5 carbohydrate esterase [Stemphylium lycopersici]|uniref:Family 5 carbohydrate esterase n=1 Tax=Stemphylium lycopersici TaxID=183478 RepID=A0A364NC34_STELY|nr:family 5 carbohydrate esterase [Stemphylium lycopersici]RAR14800.1 family 5 carbohydrate esterase [Stemphylium lycopersici]